jgi:hypothetical protein
MHRALPSLPPIRFYGVMFMHMAAFSFNFTDTVIVSLFELLANKHGHVHFRTST